MGRDSCAEQPQRSKEASDDYASDSAEFRVQRVRITVVRERKKKQAKKATKRRAKR